MQRPAALTVFGILNLVFAGLGLVGSLFSMVMFRTMQDPNVPNPVFEVMMENPAYATFSNVALVLGLVASIVLGVAGIGLLQVKPWGRHLSIGYGVYCIVMAVVGMVANYVFLFGPVMERLAELPPGPEKAGVTVGLVGGVCGGCVGLIYPIILLIFMYRANVIAAMKAQRPEDGFNF